MPLCPLALTQTLFVSPPLGRDQRPRWSAGLPLPLTLPLTLPLIVSLPPSRPPALDTSISALYPSTPRSFASPPPDPDPSPDPHCLSPSLAPSGPRPPLPFRPSSPLINCSTKYPYPPTVYNNPLNDNSNNACSKMRIKLDGALFLLHSPSRVRLGRTPETGPLGVLKIHHRKVRKAVTPQRACADREVGQLSKGRSVCLTPGLS